MKILLKQSPKSNNFQRWNKTIKENQKASSVIDAKKEENILFAANAIQKNSVLHLELFLAIALC